MYIILDLYMNYHGPYVVVLSFDPVLQRDSVSKGSLRDFVIPSHWRPFIPLFTLSHVSVLEYQLCSQSTSHPVYLPANQHLCCDTQCLLTSHHLTISSWNTSVNLFPSFRFSHWTKQWQHNGACVILNSMPAFCKENRHINIRVGQQFLNNGITISYCPCYMDVDLVFCSHCQELLELVVSPLCRHRCFSSWS